MRGVGRGCQSCSLLGDTEPRAPGNHAVSSSTAARKTREAHLHSYKHWHEAFTLLFTQHGKGQTELERDRDEVGSMGTSSLERRVSK